MPTIKIKSSNQVGRIPTTSDLLEGELAVNTADKTLFTRHGESVVELGVPLVTETEIINNSTEKRSWSVERDNQASNQWWYNSPHKTKLDSLAIGTNFGNSLLQTDNASTGRNLLGLGNVDNTSDLNKPISTATANALDGKFDKTGGVVSGATDFDSGIRTRGVVIDRMDSAYEGGQIDIRRSVDNLAAFSIDVHGATDATTLRFLRHAHTAIPYVGVPLVISSTDGVFACSTGGLGYGSGAGGAVVQPMSNTTAVTLNRPSGRIEMSEVISPGETVYFTVHSGVVKHGDLIIASSWNALTVYSVEAECAQNGYFRLWVKNVSTILPPNPPIICFAVIKGATS